MNGRDCGEFGMGTGFVSSAGQIVCSGRKTPYPQGKNQDVSRQVGTARGLRRRDKIRAKSSLRG